jgi:ribosomal peptide maturation radical SAM protein 1
LSRVALVVMPWIDVEIPPLGVAALKAYLQAGGVDVDVHYLNIKMARRLGGLMTPLSMDSLWPDWLFAYHLFGPGGSGELKQEAADLAADPAFRDFLTRSGIPLERFESLLHEDVPAFLQDCLEDIPWGEYDLIGFSSLMCTHAASLKLSRMIKERFPRALIALGGSNVEGSKGTASLSACEWIDYVVDGEGERALAALVANIARGKPYEPVPAVSLRQGRRLRLTKERAQPIDMDQLPTPDHGDYFAALERSGIRPGMAPTVSFEASRGCWWGQKQHCTFCGLNGQTMSYRSKSPALVLRDILELHRRHKATRLRACDNIMSLEHIRELLPELARFKRERGLDWEIFFETKANLTPAQIRSMREAGVTEIQPGIETLSSPILRLMRKGVTAIQNIQTLKAAATTGMRTAWNVLLGFPHEDPAEYPRAADTVLSVTHLCPPESIGQVRPDRYSPFESDPASFGIEAVEPDPAYRYLYPVSRFVLRDAAHFFHFSTPRTVLAAAYSAPLREAVEFWRRTWPMNFFVYKRGDGFVELYDSRPLALGGSPCWRRTVLEGLEAFLFVRCEELAGLGELVQAAEAAGFEGGEAAVRAALEGMAAKRWLFFEAPHYLSLAVAQSGLTPAQRAAFDRLAALEKIWLSRRDQWEKTQKRKTTAVSPEKGRI